MKSQAYWAKRAEERIEQAQAVGKVYEERLLGMYRNTLRNINRDIEKLVKRYTWSFDMSEEEALRLLQEPISMEELRLLESRLALAQSPSLKKEIQKRLEAKAYAYRISREEALKYDLKMHLDRLAHKGEGVLREGLEKVTEGAYKSILGDIGAQAGERGIGLSFAKFDSSVFERIASQKWYGRNYSERVWRNLGKLERRLETTLFEGLVKGDNTKLIARQLSQDMAVGMYEAKRLVRTETTYYTNQVARRGIEDAGLDKYEYLAAHDHRTSEICRGLDGQVFHIKDAKVGVNYPPMHPHCRSTVVAWFGEEEEPIPKGAISGAKKTEGWEDRHAVRYYEEVRNRKPYVDARKIAAHTPFTAEQIEEIRNHVFIREHYLDGKKVRFTPDYDQAITWQRLCENKEPNEVDILFLQHEYYELTLMKEKGYTYDEAHNITNTKYNWWEAYRKMNGG